LAEKSALSCAARVKVPLPVSVRHVMVIEAVRFGL